MNYNIYVMQRSAHRYRVLEISFYEVNQTPMIVAEIRIEMARYGSNWRAGLYKTPQQVFSNKAVRTINTDHTCPHTQLASQ